MNATQRAIEQAGAEAAEALRREEEAEAQERNLPTREECLAELNAMHSKGYAAAFGMPDGRVIFTGSLEYQPDKWEWAAVLRQYTLDNLPVGWLLDSRMELRRRFTKGC